MKHFIVPFLFAAAAAFVLSWAVNSSRPTKHLELRDLGPAPSFAFTDHLGQPFSSQQLQGKVWVFNLFFTSCQGPCPLLMAQVKSLLKEFKEDGPLEIVSVTVDPQRDTPEVLNEYRSHLAVRSKSWRFLTGPFDEVRTLSIDGFKLGLDEAALHSQRLVLVDAKGGIRGFFDSTDSDQMNELRGAITYLLSEGGEA